MESTDIHLVLHIGCYSSFTSQDHVPSTVHESGVADCSQTSSRYKRGGSELKSLCMFSGKKSYKKDKGVINVSTFEYYMTLEKCVNERGD